MIERVVWHPLTSHQEGKYDNPGPDCDPDPTMTAQPTTPLRVAPSPPVVPVSMWGRRVESRRRRRGLSQQQLATAAAVTQQTISKVERGVLCAHDSLKLRIAVALECPPDALFPWSDPDQSGPPAVEADGVVAPPRT